MSTLEKQWQEEYNQIERCRNIRRAQEIDLKNSMKGIEFKLRLVKKDYHKLCLERRACDKVLRNFWKRKKAELYRHRRWAADNPGKAYDNVMGVKNGKM